MCTCTHTETRTWKTAQLLSILLLFLLRTCSFLLIPLLLSSQNVKAYTTPTTTMFPIVAIIAIHNKMASFEERDASSGWFGPEAAAWTFADELNKEYSVLKSSLGESINAPPITGICGRRICDINLKCRKKGSWKYIDLHPVPRRRLCWRCKMMLHKSTDRWHEIHAKKNASVLYESILHCSCVPNSVL